jgi:hypothetical protein
MKFDAKLIKTNGGRFSLHPLPFGKTFFIFSEVICKMLFRNLLLHITSLSIKVLFFKLYVCVKDNYVVFCRILPYKFAPKRPLWKQWSFKILR